MERSKQPAGVAHPQFNRILLAVNGSEHSAAAVSVVAAIAGNSHAEVLVLNVWTPDDDRAMQDGKVAPALPTTTLVRGVVERLRALGVSTTGDSQEGASGSLAAVIASRADNFDADLIGLGNPGLSELHSFLVGSPTQQVLAQATCPVLAVRNVRRRRGNDIGRVLVALDGSNDYASVLETCVAVAQPASAEVEVIDYGYGDDPWQSAVWLAKLGVTSTWRSAPSNNHAADEILAAASSPKADLLIIGATDHGVRSHLAAYVMNRVLQSCPCPLLIVPTPELAKMRHARQIAVDSGPPGHTV